MYVKSCGTSPSPSRSSLALGLPSPGDHARMLAALSTHALDLLQRDAGGTAALVTMHHSVAEQERIAAKAQASIFVSIWGVRE